MRGGFFSRLSIIAEIDHAIILSFLDEQLKVAMYPTLLRLSFRASSRARPMMSSSGLPLMLIIPTVASDLSIECSLCSAERCLSAASFMRDTSSMKKFGVSSGR